MNKPIALLRDDVLVEILDTPVSSVIVAPDRRDDVPVRGKVLKVGPGRKAKDGSRMPNLVAPGEVIQFYFGGISLYPYAPDRTKAIVEARHVQCVLEGY